MSYIPITRDGALAVRDTDLFVQLARFCQLPDNIEYCDISDDKITYTHSVYHNDTEEILVTTDKDKIEVAKALKVLRNYVKNLK